MRRFAICLIICLSLSMMLQSASFGQAAGSRGGFSSGSRLVSLLPKLDEEIVEGFITIDGSAEIRVKPTEIRVVFAITGEATTAQECHQQVDTKIEELKSAWSELGVADEDMVEDFIAILPVFEWQVETQGLGEVAVETKTGYRMQSNIHLAIPNDENSNKMFEVAFEHGVTDIIAFDYWSKELNETKLKVREQAVKAAKSKSDTLFGELFEEAPRIINVQERTTVHFPESMYESFTNSYEERIENARRRDIPLLRAYRPQNTYYRGMYFNGDTQSQELPMNPEISVVSVVRLYFKTSSDDASKDKSE